MEKFKTKEKAAFVSGLEKIIDKELLTNTNIELEQVYLALLVEIKQKIYNKMGEVKKAYSFSFTPAQAMALRVLFLIKAKSVDMYMCNRMLQVANSIQQQYAKNQTSWY